VVRVHFTDNATIAAHVLTRLFAGHFYLTKLLLPVLIAAAKASPAGTVRVVNMSSITHNMVAPEGIRWATLGPGEEAAEARERLGDAKLFAQSQLVKSHDSPCRSEAFLNPRNLKRATFCSRMN
jgi:hypothetical protein